MVGRPGGKGSVGEGGAVAARVRAYEYYQNKLLSITGRNRSVLLRRIYTAHSCDLAALEATTPGAATRVVSRAIMGSSPARRAVVEHTILGRSAKGDDADKFRGRLKTLARNLARIEEETGHQAGYLGFPFLVGHAAPGLYVRGPVALFPVSLVPRQGARAGGWSVQFRRQAPIVNSSLFMALKKRAQHRVPDGYEERLASMIEEMEGVPDGLESRLFAETGDWLREFLPMEASSDDPRLAEISPVTRAGLEAMASDEPLRLANHKVVGSFPVADSKIYDDYAELIRRAGEPRHELIAALLDIPGGGGPAGAAGAHHAGGPAGAAADRGPAGRPGAAAARAVDIDGAASASLNTVLPSDSSQDAVILESQSSDITVVRGPPGTGKSQVIVNLVSDALMRNEKVLVVCQKRAALEVVSQRLEGAGLGRYSVFLEREVDDRLRMYRQLCDVIECGPAGGGGNGEGGADIARVDCDIDSHVGYLRDLGGALHAKLDGASAYDLYTRADASYAAVLDLGGMEKEGGLPDWGGMEAYLDRMAEVEGGVRRFDDPAGPWRGRKSFAALTNRDKGRIRDAVHRIHEGCASSVLLGSREDQSRLAAVLRMCASAGHPDSSMSGEIEDAIRIKARTGGADPGMALCARIADDAAKAQASASGSLDRERREAGDALAEFVEQYRLWEEASSLHRAAGDSVLVGGRGEQEAFAAALEPYALRPRPDAPPAPAEIENAIRIGMGAGGSADAYAAATFRARMAGDTARGSEQDATTTTTALSEFVGLCASRARAREMSRRAQGLLASNLRDQEALVAALESYTGDSGILKRQRKRAIKKIAVMGLDPSSVVGGGGGENAGRSLAQARRGLEFWRLLSAPSGSVDLERFRPVGLAAEQRSNPAPALSEVETSIEKDMDSNGLNRWAKHMIRVGAELAQGGPAVHDGAAIAQAYMDDPSPLGASARGAAARQGGPCYGSASLRGAVGVALASRWGVEAAGPVPKVPDAERYRSLAESALSEFAALHRASERARGLARLAPLCVLAKTPGEQARLPALYEASRRGGMLAGRRRKKAVAEINAIVAVGPADPGRAPEAPERGSEFWAAWPESESDARRLGIAGSEAALESRASLDSYLEALLHSIDEAMEKNPLAGWAKRLYRAGAEALSAPDGGRGNAAGPFGNAALDSPAAASACSELAHELCGRLAIVELCCEDPAAAAAAEADGYATALARSLLEPVRRGVEFWSGYQRLRAGIESSPAGGAVGPQEALEEILRARDESCRLVVQSPVSEWAKALATSSRLRGDGGGAGHDAEGRRAEAKKVARLYMSDPGLLNAGHRAGAGGRAAAPSGRASDSAADLVRLLLAELGRKGRPPEMPPLPDNTAVLYEAMIVDALSSPGGGRTLAKWVGMIMGCALPGGPGAPPDPRSIPHERASSPGFLKLEEDGQLHRVARGMRAAAERIEAGAIPDVEEGVRVWNALGEIGAYFGPGAQAAATAAPEKIESFAAGATADLEGDALDDIQELDKKKSEYEPSIFALLEMARKKAGHGEDWTSTVRREIYAHWIDRIERAHPVLRGRPIDNYNSHAKALASLADGKRALVVQEIRKRIESVRPRDVYGALSPSFAAGDRVAWRAMLGELKKRRRIMPVRRLVENYSEQLFQIAPCWLASPESISKALPLKRGLFDLVIVDEASQLAMERTIPFLYRGKRAVIAGDEKQLPPFDLFQTRTDGEGEEEDGEAAETDRQYGEKSLLDLARVRHMTTNLAWHYRSRHQGLIDFSNHAFYGGELNVVPDAQHDPAAPPIRWVKCDGMWIGRINTREADEVVAQIRGTWARAAEAGSGMPTVGVIAFNETQQNHILDRIEDARSSDGEFRRLYDLAHEGGKKDSGLFVKNIENVQGDERDVIIFSVGYARDADGRFSNRFGPLNLKGGENRLNVAVTRARKHMVVVSSIDPSMISASSEHDGPRRLRQFSWSTQGP